MRRSLGLVLFLLLAPLLFAASESQPREVGGRRGEGPRMILNATRALSDADRILLAEQGIHVTQPLAGGSRYVARVSETASLAADERIVSIEPFTAGRKVHASALRATASAPRVAELTVVFHADVPFDEAREAMIAAGVTMDVFALGYEPGRRVPVRASSASLAALAADDRVLTVFARRNFRARSDNATSAAVSKVNVVQAAPYGLTGAGVAVSLFELAAAQATHVELNGRLTVNASGGGADARHATHVAGTIAASGVRAEAKGMAPNAKLYQFCVRTSANGCTGAWLNIKEEQLAPLGIVADNNSWGFILGWEEGGDLPVWNDADIFYGYYDPDVTAPIDEIANEKGVLFVHSAGNDGNLPSAFTFAGGDGWKTHYHVDPVSGATLTDKQYCVTVNGSGTDCPAQCTGGCEPTLHHSQTPYDTMGVTAAAKNVLAVGSTDANGNISGFSSRGPAKDGRVKPDVVARGGVPGQGVLSSVPTNTYSANFWGTSMSAPVVTGISALMTEQWRNTFGATPKPEQLKAILIAGVDDLGKPGPDYTFGFGLVNAKSSADLILADGGTAQRIRTLSFAEGANQTSHEVSVVVSTPQTLRIVLNWADPSIIFLGDAEPDQRALVNDLDVRVVDPAGTVHLPYVLDPANVEGNATRAVNSVDNVEMVEIPNAAPGVYRVIANGTAVTEGPQSAVLVVNARTARPCFDVQEQDGERNNTAESAYGNLPSSQIVFGGLCSATDVDFYKFQATAAGPVTVTVTSGDTALRATLTGNGVSRTIDVPANSTATLTATSTAVPNDLTLKIEATGTIGAEPQYSFVPTFGVTTPAKRRLVRR
jgi:subtilisin family serine protease